MSSNSDKFRELQRNDATYFCSAFISSNSDTFRELLQNYIYFSELISMDTDISERYYCAIHNFSEFTPNNSDTFWELLANNTTHFFSRVHIKQLSNNSTHFFQSSYQTVTKQYYTLFSEFVLNDSDTLRELIQNNTTHFFSKFISNNTDTLREILPNMRHHSYKTILTFSEIYYQTILHTFLRVQVVIGIQGVIIK